MSSPLNFRYDLEIEEAELLRLVRDRSKDNEISSLELASKIGLDEGGVFSVAARLITMGYPIYLSSCDGWQHFCAPEYVGYWYARDADDLGDTREMVQQQLQFLQELLSGVEGARLRMAR